MPAHKNTNVSPEERARLNKRQARKAALNAERRQEKLDAGIPVRKKPRPYNYQSNAPPVGFVAVQRVVERAIATALGKARSRERSINWSKSNPEHKQKMDATYYENNRDVVIARSTQWLRENRPRLMTQPEYVIRQRLRSRLHCALRGSDGLKCDGTLELVGGSPRQLIDHLVEQINSGETLLVMQIDHIFPCSKFNLLLEANQFKMMHFTNLQPLTPFENQSKSSNLPTKAMAAKVARWAWPDGITEDMLPTIYPGWSTPLRM